MSYISFAGRCKFFMNRFEHNLKEAFVESEYGLVKENRTNDAHYQRLEKEYNLIFEAIRHRLGEDHSRLMIQLEAKNNEIKSIDDDLLYMQGMIDCVTLLKTIRLI